MLGMMPTKTDLRFAHTDSSGDNNILSSMMVCSYEKREDIGPKKAFDISLVSSTYCSEAEDLSNAILRWELLKSYSIRASSFDSILSVSSEAAAALGANSYSRLTKFFETKKGWHFGVGEPISSKCVVNLDKFLSEYGAVLSNSIGYPSIFLTGEGFIELLWKNDLVGSAYLAFNSNEIEYAVTKTGVEGQGSLEDAFAVIAEALPMAKLRSAIYV
jgi:hypothetical protein